MEVARVLELHEERIQAYRKLEESFRIFLLDEQEGIFHLAVQDATAEFQRISAELMAISKSTTSSVLADLVRRLQAEEKEKLAHTVALQGLQKRHYIDAVRAEKERRQVEAADRQGTNVLGHVPPSSSSSSSSSSSGEIRCLADKPQPPADALYDRDAGQAARAIAACIDEIRDIEMELRELAADETEKQ